MTKTDNLPDVIQMLKNRDSKNKEVAASAAEQRKQLQHSPDVMECVLGPVGGPYKLALYSADANMFMPVFKGE